MGRQTAHEPCYRSLVPSGRLQILGEVLLGDGDRVTCRCGNQGIYLAGAVSGIVGDIASIDSCIRSVGSWSIGYGGCYCLDRIIRCS